MSVPRSVADLEMKLNWAYRHLKDFEMEIRRYQDSKPHKVGQRDDVLNGLHIRRIHSTAMDDMAAMHLSDFIFQLRSSLDHLAWQLCLVGNPTPTNRKARAVYFPVLEKDDADTKQTFDRQTYGMPDEAKRLTREVQPFNNPAGHENDALWQLHKLSNIDKHRVIALGAGHSIDADVGPPGHTREMTDYGIEFRWPLSMKDDVTIVVHAVRLLVGEPPSSPNPRFELPYQRMAEIHSYIHDMARRFMPFLK